MFKLGILVDHSLNIDVEQAIAGIAELKYMEAQYNGTFLNLALERIGLDGAKILTNLFDSKMINTMYLRTILSEPSSTIQQNDHGAYFVFAIPDVYICDEFRESTVTYAVQEEEIMPYIYSSAIKNTSQTRYKTKLPDISDIEVFDTGLKTIKITFDDGTSTTATCSQNDIFDLDTGIGVCLAKRAIYGNFNGLVAKAVKIYNRKLDAEEREVRERSAAIAREKKKAEKRLARINRRYKREKAEAIDIIAEAIKTSLTSDGIVDIEGSVLKMATDSVKKMVKEHKCAHINDILELKEQGMTNKAIAEKLGISESSVRKVVRNENNE